MSSDTLRKLVFRAKYRVNRRHVPAFYRAGLLRQRLGPDELDELNWDRRRALLALAFEKSTFYRRKYTEAGLDPQDIKTREHWASIPMLTRDEIVSGGVELLTVDPHSKSLYKSATGGTTGSPITIYHDRSIPTEAFAWRMLGWWGLDPSCNGAYVWRMRIRPGLRQTINRLMWWPTIKLRYDSSSMTTEGIEGFLDAFNRLKPPLLQGYTGAVDHIAGHVLKTGAKVHQPRAIWVTSSPLSEMQRRTIEEAFGAPVYDQYGSCETTHISAQCAQKAALHIHHDSVCLEFVDEAGLVRPVGEHGRILVTDLENRAFPMIRYENGDEGRALPGLCPCGITLPLMDKVTGRVADHLKLPDGSLLAGEYLTTIFDGVPNAVRQFQVRQARDRSITVRYVPNPDWPTVDEDVAGVEREMQAKIRGQVALTMLRCDSIEHDRGKLRFVISEAE